MILSFAEFRAAADRLPPKERQAALLKWLRLMRKEAGAEVKLHRVRLERAELFRSLLHTTE